MLRQMTYVAREYDVCVAQDPRSCSDRQTAAARISTLHRVADEDAFGVLAIVLIPILRIGEPRTDSGIAVGGSA